MNGRRAKLSGLNTDHESAPSPVVADETRLPACPFTAAAVFSKNERTTFCYTIAIDYGATGLDLPVSRAVVPAGEESAS